MSDYEPYVDPSEFDYPRASDSYPGIDVPEERKERIRKLQISPDEITADDIAWNTTRNGTSYFFLLLKGVAELHGEEAAQALAKRVGYTTGRSNYRKMQRRYGVTTLTPEMVAVYEDTVHLLSGWQFAQATSEYDEREWVGYRPVCPFHTDAPEGTGHYCRFVNQGFTEAYLELDPGIEEVRYEESMMDGAPRCKHVIRYREQQEARRQADQ